MATSERARHELYGRLEEVLGEVHTDTLMSHLPPGGWAEVATKQDVGGIRRDLEGLEQRMDARFEALESRMEARSEALESRMEARISASEARFAHALTVQTRVVLVSMVALVGAVLATVAALG